jgi:hypothetical protein
MIIIMMIIEMIVFNVIMEDDDNDNDNDSYDV